MFFVSQGAEYLGEYHGNHPVIQNFWSVFNELDTTNKKKFLGMLLCFVLLLLSTHRSI